MKETVLEKLKVLAESAKYDVSCASSGVTRKHRAGGVGSAAGWGICHSFTADGRCVSLLKIMLTNVCIYDCAYCINRRSNDIPRAAFTPGELTELTIDPQAVDPDDVELLQDMILAAVNEALRAGEETREREMNRVSGGMGGMY